MLQLNKKFFNLKEGKGNEKHNKSIVEDVKHAVTVERNKMQIELNNDSIRNLTAKLKKENITEVEANSINEKIENLNGVNATLNEVIEKYSEIHARVIDTIANASKEFTTEDGKTEIAINGKDAARNTFRIIAATDNRNMFKKAIISDINYEIFYETLSNLHSMDEARFNEYGMRQVTDAGKTLYKEFNEQLSKEIYKLFSLPVENTYLKPLRFKFNKKTLAYLHESFNTGAKVSIDKDKNQFKGLEMNTIIKAVTKKVEGEETTEYTGDKFKELLAQLAVEYIIAKNGEENEYWFDEGLATKDTKAKTAKKKTTTGQAKKIQEVEKVVKEAGKFLIDKEDAALLKMIKEGKFEDLIK